MKKFLYYWTAVGVALVAFAGSAARAVTISMGIPGTNPNSSTTSPGGFIANFYQFALMVGGVLAFGVIVYGGVKYMTSAGNPSGQSDAKEWIEAALIGLLLLVGAYFVLNVVNPQLVSLNLPTNLPAVTSNGSNSGTGTGAGGTGGSGSNCTGAQLCLGSSNGNNGTPPSQ